jgi:uncharacterized membrane protein YhdT
MKNSILFLVLFLGTLLVSTLLPWWSIAPIAVALTYSLKAKPAAGFFISLTAVFLAWLISIYIVDNGTVASLMGKLFQVSAFITPLVAALLGGLLAGIFGLSGALLAPKKKTWINA